MSEVDEELVAAAAEGNELGVDEEAELEFHEGSEDQSDDDDVSDDSGEDATGGASFDDDSVLTDDGYVDHYDEITLPPYACRYCGIHDPASVARCVESNKWFCNAVGAGEGDPISSITWSVVGRIRCSSIRRVHWEIPSWNVTIVRRRIASCWGLCLRMRAVWWFCCAVFAWRQSPP